MDKEKLILTFGKYKGYSVSDEEVPASYLLWLLENVDNLTPEIKSWLEKNERALEMEGFDDQGGKINPYEFKF
jgi:uncharacterized protein (DUF3820 family)